MKTLHQTLPGVLEQDTNSRLAPGGGLLIVLGGSLLFWGFLVWAVL